MIVSQLGLRFTLYPRKQLAMTFEETYTVKGGDNLTKIAKQFGFDNPGPIHSYPPNNSLFRNRSPNQIRPGEKLRVPFHPDLLRKIIATSNHLASEISKDTTKNNARSGRSQRSPRKVSYEDRCRQHACKCWSWPRIPHCEGPWCDHDRQGNGSVVSRVSR